MKKNIKISLFVVFLHAAWPSFGMKREMAIDFEESVNKRQKIELDYSNFNQKVLFKAIKKRDWNNVIDLVRSGVDVNARNAEGETALMWAVSNDALPIVPYLIESGADINAQDKHGNTPIIGATVKNNLTIARYLIGYGANVHKQDNKGMIPLMHAAFGHNLDLVKLLYYFTGSPSLNPVEVSCNFNMIRNVFLDSHQEMPLDIEEFIKNPIYTPGQFQHELDQQLLQASRDKNWDLGKELKVKELVEQRGAQVDKRDVNNLTALMWTAIQGNSAMAHYLLERGAHVDNHDGFGKTALMMAAEYGHVETVKSLLKHGADPRVQDHSLNTALMLAMSLGDFSTVQLLVESAKVDVNVQNGEGLTALMVAAVRNKPAFINYLIERGASVDLEDTKGRTAFMWALYYNNLGIAGDLYRSMNSKPDLDILHEKLEGLIKESAPEVKLPQSLEIFLKNLKSISVKSQDKPDDQLLQIMKDKDWNENKKLKLKKLLEQDGACIEVRDKNGRTPLIWAVIHGDLEMIKYLLGRGAQIDACDTTGAKILTYAALYKKPEVIKYLVEDKEVSVNGADSHGRTALVAAAYTNNLDMAKYLLKHGADVKAHDTKGRTALTWAAHHNNVPMTKLLYYFTEPEEMPLEVTLEFFDEIKNKLALIKKNSLQEIKLLPEMEKFLKNPTYTYNDCEIFEEVNKERNR